MQKNVLVASPHPAFRQLLRRSLEDSGRFSISLEASLERAAQRAAEGEIDLVIFDADSSTPSEQAALLRLLQARPALPLILFPPDNDLNHPFLNDQFFAAVLSKPFYFPDLMAALDGLPPEPASTPAGWVTEEQAAAQSLAGLVAETAAQAGFILQGRQVLTHAGRLDAPDSEAVVQVLTRAWHTEHPSHLVRYIYLSSSGSDVLVYATPLAEGQILGLVFSKETSVKQARAITALVAQAVAPQFAAPVIPASPPPAAPELPDDPAWIEADSAEVPIEDLNLQEILANLPDPDPIPPAAGRDAGAWVPEKTAANDGEFRFPWERSDESNASPSLEATPPTRPGPAARSAPGGGLPVQTTRQAYSCILIPADPEIALTGRLAEFLHVWVPEYCHKFGWELTGLTLTAAYLEWTVQVAPAVSPGNLARMLRQQSSLLIRQKFPETFASEEPTDFWAPGLLVVSGRQPPSDPMIADYIQQTRRRQGKQR